MTKPNIWQGQKVRLRAIEPEDWTAFHAANQDTDLARYGYAIPFPQSAESVKSWAAKTALAHGENDEYRFVIENLQGEIVGTLNTTSCDRRHGTFTYGIIIFRECWRQGYASEAIRLVLRYFFQELRYQKVTVYVYDFNDASLALHKSLGFQQEGRLRRMIFTDGVYHDEIYLGLTAEEFQNLPE